MKPKLEKGLIKIIESDKWMITILKTVRDLNLNDSWIGAGFIRNKIWDEKHRNQRTKLNDIDVIYFDKNKSSKKHDLLIENKLKLIDPILNWSVKNQFRMNIRNGHEPYSNCEKAISFWPETATAIAIRITQKNKIEYIAPYGLEDLFNLMVIPTPKFNLTIYNNRIKKKMWSEKWPKLSIKLKYES
ncbi:nucleotidyltransferase family protein [uncultured Tenacibaculum sp.]|uniref:nucleotidyltransferase family protein n=1 Tax=uncultured Tenacibaculum sp. TaxID=174713 RepID=UPI0026151B14|nr:nucleotidyltransferase family protein [uncultured Tenacibaculum sp.]